MKEITIDCYEWKCMKITEPSDFETFVDSNKLIGRKVVGMEFVGIDLDQNRYDTEILQSAETNEPFRFQFEDGNHWDIYYSLDSLVYTSINGLSETTHSRMGDDHPRRINADHIFSDIYGCTITNVIINHIPKDDYVWTMPYYPEENWNEDRKECFNEIIIEFSNGCKISLNCIFFYSWIILKIPYNGLLPKYACREMSINFGRKKPKYIKGKTYRLYVNTSSQYSEKARLARNKKKAEYIIVGKFIYNRNNQYEFGHVAVFENK